jgi:hypothetical protein
MVRMSGKNGREIAVQAELCRGQQGNASAGFDETFQMSGNLRRRKPIEPELVARGLELPLLDCVAQDKTSDAIDQGGHDTHLGNIGRTPERSDRRFMQNSTLLLERAVSPLSCRSQSVQLAVSFRSSGDFKNRTRMLSNRDMSGKSEPIGTMRTVPVKIETGRKLGFDALLEAGKRNPLSGRVKTIRPSGKMAIRNVRLAVAIIASFKESFTNQLFIPGIVID